MCNIEIYFLIQFLFGEMFCEMHLRLNLYKEVSWKLYSFVLSFTHLVLVSQLGM